MTKTLLLMRHAKSSWKDESLADHDRPLAKRGKRDAPRIGRLLRERQLVPDRIVSSTAERARATSTLVAHTAGCQTDVLLTEDLYHVGLAGILDVVGRLEDQYSRVLVVGHNPGMVDLLEHLTGDGQSFPTAAIAVLRWDVLRWHEIDLDTTATLIDLWRPRELT